MEKLTRPDPQQLKSLIQTAVSLDTRLKAVVDAAPSLPQNARTAAQALFDARLRQTLEEMDIEQVNRGRQGIRVSVLRDSGIANILRLSQTSYTQLCALDGIGEQGAWKILDITKQIVRNTEDTLRVRIRADRPKAEDLALIRALYILMNARPLAEALGQVYKENHAGVTAEVALAKQGLNGLSWLFKSQASKKRIIEAATSLESRLGGSMNSADRLDAFQSVLSVPEEQTLADFAANSPKYYAELERLGLNWVQTGSGNTGLPAELTQAIQAQELDLIHFKATLRGYQTFGTQYIVHQKKALLGDEMGLGKTIQAIAAMSALKAAGQTHFMVVCPASVLINWCREIRKHSDLEVYKVHGNDAESLLQWRMNGDVAVTTYESISRFRMPEKFPISMVVADEAHYAKNPQTRRTKALVGLLNKSEYALFMTGTPLENRVEEMCFLVKCLQPELAASLEEVKYLSTAEQFRQQLAPVYLRRTREDVLQELPDLTEKEQWCEQNAVERKAYYGAVMSENFMAMRQVSWNAPPDRSSKAQRLVELCEQAKEENRKVIVFSFFRETLKKVSALLADRCMEPITGSVSPLRRQEIIDEFTAADSGAVLVSQVQAGGTGLNIQSASVIIFCEPQIKPSIENQAIARAYRMGQVRDVLVYRLLSEDSVDEKVMELLRQKQEVFDHFADESVVGEESLKAKEQDWIARMVAEEKQRLLGNPIEEVPQT